MRAQSGSIIKLNSALDPLWDFKMRIGIGQHMELGINLSLIAGL